MGVTPAVAFDTHASGLLAGPTPLYAGVGVHPPSMRAPLSASAARDFIRRFACSMESSGRVFSTAELTEALQRAYPGAPATTAKQVRRLLREMRPDGWANGGRRARFQIPSATEIATAGEAAGRSQP